MKIACAFLFVAAAIVAVQADLDEETEMVCEDYPAARCRSKRFVAKCADYCETVKEMKEKPCKDKKICKALAEFDEDELVEECASSEVMEACPVTCGECEPPEMPDKVEEAAKKAKKTCKTCSTCLKTKVKKFKCKTGCKRCKKSKKALKKAMKKAMKEAMEKEMVEAV